MQAVIGIDFGTESARAALFNIENGSLISEISETYEHGIILSKDPEFKRHHPDDYLNFLKNNIFKILRKDINVLAIGFDFTDCTLIAVDEDFNALFHKGFDKNPRSLIKLYADHTAIQQAEKINNALKNEELLKRCGGETSPEWWLAKVLNDFEEDREFFNKVGKYIHAGDWVIQQLTGIMKPNACSAGYKAHLHNDGVMITDKLLKKISKDKDVVKVRDKLITEVFSPGILVGGLKKEWAEKLGLSKDVKVAVGMIDAHALAIGAGIKRNTLVAVVGTTTCEMYCGNKRVNLSGMNVVKDGILPSLYGYEAGQAGTGIMYNHFAELFFRGEKRSEVFTIMRKKLGKENPLIVIPWWRGSRTPVADNNFTGVIFGLTDNVKPEHIYQAMLDATAFATKEVIELLNENGLKVNKVILSGGIPLKDEAQNEAYAYATGMNVDIATNHGCLGAAILAAKAFGKYKTIEEAQDAMTQSYKPVTYKPTDKGKLKLYREKFRIYQKLSRALAYDCRDQLKLLKQLHKED